MLLDVGFEDVLVNAIKTLRSDGGGVLSGDFNTFHKAFIIIAAAGVLFFITKRFFEDQSGGRPFDISRYTKPFMILIMLVLYKPIMGVIDGFFDTMTTATYKTDGRFMLFGADVTNATIGGTSIGAEISSLLSTVLLVFGGSGGGAVTGTSFASDTKGTPEQINKMNEILNLIEGDGTDDNIMAINNEISQGPDQKDVTETKETGLVTNIFSMLGETINPLTKITAYVMLILLYAFGPLALGLSVWPGFESSLTNFIGSYLKVSMWPAIANLVAYLVFKIITSPSVLTTLTANNLFNNGRETKLAPIFFGAIFITHMMVPRISAAIVNAGGFSYIDKNSKENGYDLQRKAG